MKPIQKTVVYKKDFSGWLERKIKEKIILKDYDLFSEEEVKEYSAGKGCLLFLIFPPLAFFGKTRKTKVTYKLKK